MDKLSIEYGGGLFELANDEGIVKELLVDVRALKSVFADNQEYVRLMTSARVTKHEKALLLKESFEGRVHPYLYNFICLMADRDYFSYIPQCLERYEECYRESEGIILVKVKSATALTDAQKESVIASVEKRTRKKAETEFIVDPSLMAGLRVEAGNVLFENSAKSKFEEMRRLLQVAVTGDNT